ncbi:MAG: permease-like cell division protein FtsX [Gallintestinimicrobium sp.]
MRISTFFYTLKQGVINIFRNKLFSLASIATISACLFLFGLFYAVILNFQNVVRTAEEDVSVTVFFKDGTTQEEMEQIGAQIRARDEVSEAKFISADEAWAEWAPENIGEDYNEIYTENPLEGMDNYEIYMNDVSKQESLVGWLESIPQVDEVRYSEVAATTLTGVNALVAYTSVGIIAILLAVSVFLINNTVMIGISVRKSEIEIMKYIGATDFFVRSPFVIEGILIGLIGSLLPLGLIYVLYKKVIDYVMIEFPSLSGLMQFLPVSEIYRTLLPVCLGLGAGIGFLGSFITVRKHLRV